MSAVTVRRRSSQYSLFPSCSPTPMQNNPTSPPPNGNGNIGNLPRNLHKRHSEGSVRERARNISFRSLRASLSTNDFQSSTRTSKSNDNSNNYPDLATINHQHQHQQQAKKQPNNMDRLIPLKLEASMSDTKSPPTSPKSLPLLPLTEVASVPIPAPLNPAKPTKKSRPGPVTDLTILPYTQKEWAAVMEEVRMLYSKGQYKHCAMRCKQILDGIKDPYGVHPLYSIYLSFFAASSLEMTASTLHNHSSTKLPLFQESLAFYQKAETFVDYASFSSDPNIAFATRQISMYGHASHSSLSSSIRSSVDSVFSQASGSAMYSASSTYGGDSPTFEESSLKRSASNSSSSEESEGSRRRSGRFQSRKKKVSFSLQLPTLDSETSLDLSSNPGNGDAIAATSIADASTLLDAFPAPPSKESSPSRASSPAKSPRESLSSIYLSQSVTRYHTHLTSLKSQLGFHISSIHAQISTLSEVRRPRRSNTPTQYSFDREGGEELEKSLPRGRSGSANGEERERESRRPELRERIERLKEMGWKRKRFDGEKYRVLCEKALGEVNERP